MLWRLSVVWSLLVLPVLLGFGFTVDDAWIPARVAHHLTTGAGYRFNVAGPVEDAVTPLGWAQLLTLLSGPSITETVWRARVLGCVAWAFGALALSFHIEKMQGSALRYVPVGVAALCLPLGAWVSSGLETGVVVATCALGVALPRKAFPLLGLAAAWRPELLPWACCASLAFRTRTLRTMCLRLLTTLAPCALVALIRLCIFGSVVPLAFFAKPSDFEHGLFYVWGAFRLTGLPILLVALSWKTVERYYRGLALATAIHGLSIALVGGDWMSLFRLMIPVLPGTLLVAAALARHAPPWATAVRASVAMGFSIALLVTHGRSSRSIWQQRLDLIRNATPLLAKAAPVGSADVGWVGATTQGEVVDFSGVTDARVAFLPGGHTSKRLPSVFLSQRGVKTLLVLIDATGQPARAIDRRARELALPEGYLSKATLPLGDGHLFYQVLQLGTVAER